MGKTNTYDVVVVGGGPAGAMASTVLAMHGHQVLLLEKEKFPRYHIGESFLPYSYFPLQRIGMVDKLGEEKFVRKYAVQFASGDGRVSAPFYFHTHLDHEAAITWQVLRSEFDQILLDNAREKGVEVREETRATAILRDDGKVVGVKAIGRAGREYDIGAAMTIDASGRDIFTLSRNNGRKWDPVIDKTAVWTYYRGALRDPGVDEGTTTVAMVPERGWFWYIPQRDDMVSVGLVAEKDYLFSGTRDLDEIFQREVGNNLWIKQHLAPGQQVGKYYVTREYSYRGEHCAEDGLVLVGDAFAFLDPVFSSGVYFALRSGELAADQVHDCLRNGDVTASRFTSYAERICGEIEAMRKLIYVFYHPGFSFGRLIRANPEVRGDLTDCLIGNLDKDFHRLFDAVAEQAAIPAPLPFGRPRVAS